MAQKGRENTTEARSDGAHKNHKSTYSRFIRLSQTGVCSSITVSSLLCWYQVPSNNPDNTPSHFGTAAVCRDLVKLKEGMQRVKFGVLCEIRISRGACLVLPNGGMKREKD